MLSGNGTLPQNDSGDTGDAGKFRDLIRDVLTVDSFDVRAELLCQFSVFFQPPFVFLGGKGKIRRFHKQCRELTVESLCHSCSGADDPCVGGSGRQAGENVVSFAIIGMLIHLAHSFLFFLILTQIQCIFHSDTTALNPNSPHSRTSRCKVRSPARRSHSPESLTCAFSSKPHGTRLPDTGRQRAVPEHLP